MTRVIPTETFKGSRLMVDLDDEKTKPRDIGAKDSKPRKKEWPDFGHHVGSRFNGGENLATSDNTSQTAGARTVKICFVTNFYS
jgi:hypothetical protein